MKINNDVVLQDFDPQGSREPRHNASIIYPYLLNNFDPQGSREPRRKLLDDYRRLKRISIHRALASLDGPEDTNRNTV